MRSPVTSWYSLARVLLAAGSVSPLAAVSAQQPGLAPLSLTVRPQEMRLGARTQRQGENTLDAFPAYRVYVPSQCVGVRRCPLVVFLHQSDTDWAADSAPAQYRLADRYGMILLVTSSEDWLTITFGPVSIPGLPYLPDPGYAIQLDTALHRILQRYAIDPARIALVGNAAGGGYALSLACANPGLFSRIAAISPTFYFTGEFATSCPGTSAAPVFLSEGLGELDAVWTAVFTAAHALRQGKHPVTLALELRGHPVRVPEYDRMWRWLQESWAHPDHLMFSPPPISVDSLPVLTDTTLAQCTAFWMRFLREPSAISTTARLAYQRQVTIPIGKQRVQVTLVDLSALATATPEIGRDLRTVGLTARQAERLRLALIVASAARRIDRGAGWGAAPSALKQNLAFLDSHRAALLALGASGMWTAP